MGKTKPIPKWYCDPFALIFNGLTASFLFITNFCPLLSCLAEVDPTNLVFPEPNGIPQQCLHFFTRFILASLSITQMCAILSSTHLAVFIIISHFKASVGFLKFYMTQAQKNRNPVKGNRSKLKENDDQFLAMTDLQLYRSITVANQRVRQYTDTAAGFIMGPGFFIDVTCNYVVVMLVGNIPLLFYLIIAVLDIVVHTLIVMEVPQAGDVHYVSTNLLKYWKLGDHKRRLMRQNAVNSFRPAGVGVGHFFVVKKETLFSYVHEIMIKMVDSILLGRDAQAL